MSYLLMLALIVAGLAAAGGLCAVLRRARSSPDLQSRDRELTVDGWLQIAFSTVAVALLVRPLGGYMVLPRQIVPPLRRNNVDQRQPVRHVSRRRHLHRRRLTFLPALSLGPIAEQVMMQAGQV
jgi:hypothetical protein